MHSHNFDGGPFCITCGDSIWSLVCEHDYSDIGVNHDASRRFCNLCGAAVQPDVVPEGCCPSCAQPVVDHFTLAGTPQEIENWSQSDVVCWRTRGDVQALIDEANRG